MKNLVVFCLFIFSSCQTLPELYKSVEDIANDDVISVEICKEAFQEDKDVTVEISIKNAEP